MADCARPSYTHGAHRYRVFDRKAIHSLQCRATPQSDYESNARTACRILVHACNANAAYPLDIYRRARKNYASARMFSRAEKHPNHASLQRQQTR